MEALKERFILNFVTDDRWKYITDGLKVTLEVTFLAVLIGILLGLFVAIVRSTYDKTHKLKILNFICNIYIQAVIRNIDLNDISFFN